MNIIEIQKKAEKYALECQREEGYPSSMYDSYDAKEMRECAYAQGYKDALKCFENKVTTLVAPHKEVLTVDEASKYTGMAKSYLYKLMMRRQIPHYKSPTGKKCFFNRQELINWLQSNRVATDAELSEKAHTYVNTHDI